MPSTPRSPTLATNSAFAASAIAFAAFVGLFLPYEVYVFNDDFAYLRSLVATLQHGWPTTDEFLEPWSASLSVVSAAAYRITGSLAFATLGLQRLLPVISFYALCRALYRVGWSGVGAITVALIVLTLPTALWKQAEYTAFVVYLPALAGAAWAASERKWLPFLVAFAVGVASRQSALVWLALPVATLIGRWRQLSRRDRLVIGLVLVAAATWTILLAHGMNETAARRNVLRHARDSLTAVSMLRHGGAALWVAVATAGLALLLSGQPSASRATTAHRIRRAVALVLVATILLVGRGEPISIEHPFQDFSGRAWYLCGLLVLAALGWWRTPVRLDPIFAGAIAASVALVAVRAILWDYYLADIVIMTLLALPVAESGEPTRGRMLFRAGAAAAVAFVAVMGSHAAIAGCYKRALDERAAHCAILERALRAGWMKPTELSHAPFGFVAWHLFPYYITHEGRQSGDLGGFGIYVGHQLVDVRAEDIDATEARRRQQNPDPAKPFALVHRRGWTGYTEYWLWRRPDGIPPQLALDEQTYRPTPFPLNDTEWRQHIQR